MFSIQELFEDLIVSESAFLTLSILIAILASFRVYPLPLKSLGLSYYPLLLRFQPSQPLRNKAIWLYCLWLYNTASSKYYNSHTQNFHILLVWLVFFYLFYLFVCADSREEVKNEFEKIKQLINMMLRLVSA